MPRKDTNALTQRGPQTSPPRAQPSSEISSPKCKQGTFSRRVLTWPHPIRARYTPYKCNPFQIFLVQEGVFLGKQTVWLSTVVKRTTPQLSGLKQPVPPPVIIFQDSEAAWAQPGSSSAPHAVEWAATPQRTHWQGWQVVLAAAGAPLGL